MKNIFKNISTFFLIISLFVFLYILYRSEIHHSGTKFDYYFKYYITSFTLITLSITSFLLKKDLKINISIVLASTLVGLYLVEGYFTFTFTERSVAWKYKKNTGKEFDSRTQYQVYDDLKKNNPNVVVHIQISEFLSDINQSIFPLSGISNSKTIMCNEGGYYSIFKTDRYGFNNPNAEWDKNEIEFLLIGDSLVHGACVNEPDTIGGNLRKLLTAGGVLNLGQADTGPLIEYAILREYLSIKNVKRILWVYYEGNDTHDLIRELDNPILLNYLIDNQFSQDLKTKQSQINKKLLTKLNQLKKQYLKNLQQENNYLVDYLKLYKFRAAIIESFFSPRSTPPPLPEEFKEIILLSNELSTMNGSKFYFVYLPDVLSLNLKTTSSNYFLDSILGRRNTNHIQKYDKVIEMVEDLNIPIIDINAELLKKQKDVRSLFPFEQVGHYNELGYKLIAETIFKKIEELENLK